MPSQGPADARAPVAFIPSDTPERGPEDGVALCLSGGGYRAMLFHLGALWRINELALLPRLARISSVSPGSIVAGLLGLKWQVWRFMKPYSRDYRVGEIPHSTVELARAVAASSAFPPFLSPARFRFREADYTKGSGQDLQYAPYTTGVQLTDGGVYDNLGLETTWKRYRTVLVSDAAARVQPQEKVKGNWISQSIRVEELVHAQVGSLRKRQLIASYLANERQGAYWGIGSDISNYALADALPCPPGQTAELAKIPTRLKQLDATVQERLIDWGYAICDAALRKHFDPAFPKATRFPFQRGV